MNRVFSFIFAVVGIISIVLGVFAGETEVKPQLMPAHTVRFVVHRISASDRDTLRRVLADPRCGVGSARPNQAGLIAAGCYQLAGESAVVPEPTTLTKWFAAGMAIVGTYYVVVQISQNLKDHPIDLTPLIQNATAAGKSFLATAAAVAQRATGPTALAHISREPVAPFVERYPAGGSVPPLLALPGRIEADGRRGLVLNHESSSSGGGAAEAPQTKAAAPAKTAAPSDSVRTLSPEARERALRAWRGTAIMGQAKAAEGMSPALLDAIGRQLRGKTAAELAKIQTAIRTGQEDKARAESERQKAVTDAVRVSRETAPPPVAATGETASSQVAEAPQAGAVSGAAAETAPLELSPPQPVDIAIAVGLDVEAIRQILLLDLGNRLNDVEGMTDALQEVVETTVREFGIADLEVVHGWVNQGLNAEEIADHLGVDTESLLDIDESDEGENLLSPAEQAVLRDAERSSGRRVPR